MAGQVLTLESGRLDASGESVTVKRYFTVAVKTSSITNGRRQPVAGT